MDLSGDQVGPHALARHPHPDQVLGLVAEHTAISRGMGERRNENNERDESGGEVEVAWGVKEQRVHLCRSRKRGVLFAHPHAVLAHFVMGYNECRLASIAWIHENVVCRPP